MTITQSFGTILNEYLTEEMLQTEAEKRDYLFSVAEKDNGWKGGTYPVPFRSAMASSVEFGQFADDTDVAEAEYIRGSIASPQIITGTMVFNQRDLMEHDGKIPETTFLDVLEGTVDDFMQIMKMKMSINMLSGGSFTSVNANGDVNGYVGATRIDRFQRGEKIFVKGTALALTAYYVIEVDINTSLVRLSAARGGAGADVTALTTADNVKFYHPGALTSSFQSLQDALLSATNGGGTTLHGKTKTLYPFLQAYNADGSAAGLNITASNLLDKVFDAVVTQKIRTGARPTEVWVSYKHWGTILKLLELQKGAYRTKEGSMNASIYGWDEVEISGIKGTIKFVAIQEMSDDLIYLIDLKAFKIASNGFLKKVVDLDGNQYYKKRTTSGYKYFVDFIFEGEFVVRAPWRCGVIFGVSY